MGCTSSAPSVATPDANTASDKNINTAQNISEKETNSQDKISKEHQNETIESNVLPRCDSLAEHNIQVFSNNKSLTDLRCLDNVREDNKMENDDGDDKCKTPTVTQDDKISGLENIVKRVIEKNVMDNIMNDTRNSPKEGQTNHNSEDKKNENESTITLQVNNINLSDNEEKVQKNDKCEETASPTKSESSRVTRWEALADIAAELPPSLAVDPITGQIYALSK